MNANLGPFVMCFHLLGNAMSGREHVFLVDESAAAELASPIEESRHEGILEEENTWVTNDDTCKPRG